jgi:hypothetical protein
VGDVDAFASTFLRENLKCDAGRVRSVLAVSQIGTFQTIIAAAKAESRLSRENMVATC